MDKAIGSLGLRTLDEGEVAGFLDSLVTREAKLIAERGESAFSELMGEAMKELRGKADGAVVARILREKLNRAAGR